LESVTLCFSEVPHAVVLPAMDGGLDLVLRCPHLPLCVYFCCSLRESLSAPLNALRKAAREVGTAAADAKLGVVVDDFVDKFRWVALAILMHGQLHLVQG
jgi:hypothetical protein